MIGALGGIGVIMMRTMIMEMKIMNLIYNVPKQAIKASRWWWLWWHGVLTQ